MKDFKLDDTGDIETKNGDFVVLNNATNQHQKHLIFFEKGEIKENLLVGVGIQSFLLDDADGGKLLHEVQNQFEKDGMKIERLTIDQNYNIEYKAKYKKDERR
ncbi:hypothetical protein PL373_05915 [Tenacibaculum maritimum]|nr:hypothetical protein [Tenacibaculum maritimum]MDB0600686.1 hypothetical protein [Tenacibaculum maritimum]MDB0612669.1 hypothetical protein [Tenacibaculum maritimum]